MFYLHVCLLFYFNYNQIMILDDENSDDVFMRFTEHEEMCRPLLVRFRTATMESDGLWALWRTLQQGEFPLSLLLVLFTKYYQENKIHVNIFWVSKEQNQNKLNQPFPPIQLHIKHSVTSVFRYTVRFSSVWRGWTDLRRKKTIW